MKLIVAHDQDGVISSIGIAGPLFAGNVGMHPQPGQTVSVIDTPERLAVSRLPLFMKEFRVEQRAGRLQLAKKP